MEQLTTLKALKEWLGDGNSTTNDALYTRLIEQASRFILNYIQCQTLFKTAVTEPRDGFGGQSMILSQFPVATVNSVNIDGVNIPAAASVNSSGYRSDIWNVANPPAPQAVVLNGYAFNRGLANVVFNYIYGFFITDEPQTVPSSDLYNVNVSAPYGNWGRDDGVKLANGTVLTKVAKNPAALQYCIVDGTYQFNAAQAGAAVLISYSYVPADIEQCCIELAGERFRYSKRIGQQSNSSAGQITTSFSLKAMPDYVKEILDLYVSNIYI